MKIPVIRPNLRLEGIPEEPYSSKDEESPYHTFNKIGNNK